jgi:coenzyme F420 hydrogenase subunit beta
VVVRNPQFLQWIKEAAADGCMEVQSLDTETLLKSQVIINHKKRRPATFMKWDQWLGRKIPQYDVDLKDDSFLKSTISYIHTLMQIFIGKYKSLWFMIPFLKQKPPVE